MGGRAYYRKQKFILKWTLAAGLVVSLVLAVILYWLNHPGK
jgi:high-affinity Fe2+/Pb2+ permease